MLTEGLHKIAFTKSFPFFETEIETACASSPCVNDGTCVVDGEGYRCQCPPGWVGRRCGTSKLKYSNAALGY